MSARPSERAIITFRRAVYKPFTELTSPVYTNGAFSSGSVFNDCQHHTSLKEKLIKIGAKVVSDGRYVAFQMAEVAISTSLFADILRLIAEPRPPSIDWVMRSVVTHQRANNKKMARNPKTAHHIFLELYFVPGIVFRAVRVKGPRGLAPASLRGRL
jgi:hypothetical protein